MKFFDPEMLSDETLEGASICHYEIEKDEVESEDFDRLDGFMETLKMYGASARQKVWFTFSGYDDDKRELVFIPEVVQFIKTLLNRHPYFWYFAIPYNSECFYLVVFLQKDSTVATIPLVQKFYIKQDVELIQRFISVLAMNLNIFGEEIDDIKGSAECLKLWSSQILNLDPKELGK